MKQEPFHSLILEDSVSAGYHSFTEHNKLNYTEANVQQDGRKISKSNEKHSKEQNIFAFL